jgi:hypothetical protein
VRTTGPLAAACWASQCGGLTAHCNSRAFKLALVYVVVSTSDAASDAVVVSPAVAAVEISEGAVETML